MASIVRFLVQYARSGGDAVHCEESGYVRDGERLPASVYVLAGRRREAMPGWVLLHGLTVTGRAHPSLDRFARALAASGAIVFVPEIPEWRRLEPAPARSLATIRAALEEIGRIPGVDDGRIALLGFSFGATQALMAAADPQCASRLRAVAAWGGYSDLHRLCRFGVTGDHELDGQRYRLEPDPYGRWLMLGNYLTGIPGHEGHHTLAAAFRNLALEAGRSGVFAGDPVHDALKLEFRRVLSDDERYLWDLAAPMSGQPIPDPDEARAIAAQLADAALARDPLLDPRPYLPNVRVPTFLAHGRDDRVVPFTETIRAARALGPECRRSCTITALFAHSGGAAQRFGTPAHVRESVRFVALLRRLLMLPTWPERALSADGAVAHAHS